MLSRCAPKPWWLLTAVLALLHSPTIGHAACCYFSAQNSDILQPGQKKRSATVWRI